MNLAHAILKGIANERSLDGHFHVASPLRDLVEQYNKLAMHDDSAVKITALSTGSQLKAAITAMDPEVQVTLLHKYSKATRNLDTPSEYREDPAKQELRQMRMFMFKACVFVIGVLFCVTVGVSMSVAAKTGTIPNQNVFSTLISTAGEILKVILSGGK